MAMRQCVVLSEQALRQAEALSTALGSPTGPAHTLGMLHVK